MNASDRPVARLDRVTLRYGRTIALDAVNLVIPANRMIGVIGPDGVGKSSLLALLSGARKIQSGSVNVLDGDMRSAIHRARVGPRIAYMPQGLGKNLYPTLSVFENVDFFGRLFGHARTERQRRIAELLESTGLAPFADRPAGKLSGGMKQKLGLCCALIHDPELLILDEPTTGVDPLARNQFWDLITSIRRTHSGMSAIVATAHMDEAACFDWLAVMDAGRVLATDSPDELLRQTGTSSLEEAFVALLPVEKRQGHRQVLIPSRASGEAEIAIEARCLSKRFGDFTAVDRVSFQIERGEIFGFLGSNGCGKTTTMKMLTGLLPASEGEAWLFGQKAEAEDVQTRRRVGYMSQSFSLYTELTVRQNLELHARLFDVPAEQLAERVRNSVARFGLAKHIDSLPVSLPLGLRQRLSLAVALIHEPDLLILDEPTSGVDPVARDAFWQLLVELSRRDQVTIFISTHFVNEAARCDRISLMHAGRVLVSDTPAGLIERRGAGNLDEAFVAYLRQAADERELPLPPVGISTETIPAPREPRRDAAKRGKRFSLQRLLSYSRREALELRRDPIRATLAVAGSMILMFIMGYGISMDVEDLPFAVLDRDQTTQSQDYRLNLAGSRYFVERPSIADYDELDRRMRSGELSLAIEIPHGFGRDIARRTPVEIGAWIDGAMPMRAETVQGYVRGMHSDWLSRSAAKESGGPFQAPAIIETRFRYNPDVESLPAMVPAVIPLLLLLIPAMLTALSIVREKELGSIINFYATPVSRLEFLLGKQIPYVALGMLNFLLLTALAVLAFGVPLTGSFWALASAAFIYVACATALGLVISTFMRSQIAAIFGTAVLTILPAVSFSGIIDPVSSLQGMGALVGRIYPTTHFLTISRGVFSKGLGFEDLGDSFPPLAIAAPALVLLAVKLLDKQET